MFGTSIPAGTLTVVVIVVVVAIVFIGILRTSKHGSAEDSDE